MDRPAATDTPKGRSRLLPSIFARCKRIAFSKGGNGPATGTRVAHWLSQQFETARLTHSHAYGVPLIIQLPQIARRFNTLYRYDQRARNNGNVLPRECCLATAKPLDAFVDDSHDGQIIRNEGANQQNDDHKCHNQPYGLPENRKPSQSQLRLVKPTKAITKMTTVVTGFSVVRRVCQRTCIARKRQRAEYANEETITGFTSGRVGEKKSSPFS